MKTIAILPARIGSTRLPEKPLADINGKPLIQWVYENVKRCDLLDKVIVATDSEKIIQTVSDFEGYAVMTSGRHRSGTDRIAEVAKKIEGDVIINIQGDEPFINQKLIMKALHPFKRGFQGISTLKTRVKDNNELTDKNIVKVVCNKDNEALYFSRSSIPYERDDDVKSTHFKHIGLYAYDRETLFRFTSLGQCDLEKAEKLEQLRALYHGIPIKVSEIDYDGVGIDTVEDLEKARRFLR